MLQVPCLSPPVYGHSHYKKFWLRQTEVKESSVAGVACEMMKSTSTSSPEAASSSKRICGKRRPSHVRSSLASPAELERIKVPVNECLSPTSSGEIPAASGWKKSCYSRKSKRGSDGSSTVSSLEADVGAAAAASAAAGSRSPAEDDKSFITMSIEGSDCNPSQKQQQSQPRAATTTTQPEVMLVRHNMSSNESPLSSAAASLDCLTSKCKSADSSLLRQDTDEESDSATSSTSQASDNDDTTRCRTSFRGHLKRRDPTTNKPAVVAKDEKCVASVAAGCISSSSPKTRQATAGSSPIDSGGLRSPGHGSSPGGMNNVSRTCKHCGTMKTPLWRNGPLGPKSLCNACGIRLRKARRSSGNQEGQTTPTTTTSSVPGKRKHNQAQQAEAGSGAAGTGPTTTTTTTTTTFLGGVPYKKSRVAFKAREQGSEQGFIAAKLSLLGSKSLSTDEEEGAVLLMALSCGLVLA